MYEAPDRYKRMISARLPGGESLGLSQSPAGDGDGDDDMSSPLRDTQLLARAQLAPFFASANAVAALLIAATLFNQLSLALLAGWAGAVWIVNLGAMHLARTQAITHVGRSGRKVPQWQMVGEVVGRALLFLSLPVACFSGLDPNLQVIVASLLAGLGIAALGLVVVPACVTAWMSCFVAERRAHVIVAVAGGRLRQSERFAPGKPGRNHAFIAVGGFVHSLIHC